VRPPVFNNGKKLGSRYALRQALRIEESLQRRAERGKIEEEGSWPLEGRKKKKKSLGTKTVTKKKEVGGPSKRTARLTLFLELAEKRKKTPGREGVRKSGQEGVKTARCHHNKKGRKRFEQRLCTHP